MTAPFPARRRAEEFDALIGREPSTTLRPPLTERDAQRFAALLAVVDDLRAVPEVVPRAEFTAALRERLMLEADTVLVAGPPRDRAAEARLVLPTRSRARDRRLATLLGGAALIGATTSMAVAAQTALPGDSLYPVKRAIEDARAGLATDDADRGAALLAHASGRLDEVAELARTSSPTRDAAVADTLTAFDEQATEASEVLLDAHSESGDELVVRSLRDFVRAGLSKLSTLESVVSDSARDELVGAGRTLAAIDARAATACPECGGSAATLPPFILSAVVPGQDVASVLSASAASIVDRGRTGQPAIPVTISGQDVGGIVVPDLDTTLPGGGAVEGGATGVTGGAEGGSRTPGAVPSVGAGLPSVGPGLPSVGSEVPSVGSGVPSEESGTGAVEGAVPGTVDDVTKLLTGDVPTHVNEVPVVGPLVGPVDGTLDDVTGGVGDTLDPLTDSLLD